MTARPCKRCLLFCHTNCPNSILCGENDITACILALNKGLCVTCILFIGCSVEVVTHHGAKVECCICLAESHKSVVFPQCPNKHMFCIDCTKTMVFGQNGFDGEGCITACPLCRHENVF